MIEETLQETKERMGKTITDLKMNSSGFAPARASLSLLDGIRVDYYGTQTR
jgi:ribosome recycling factor